MHHLSIFIKHFFSSLPIGVSLMTLALYAHGSFCVNDQELPILVHIRHVCRHYIFSNGFPNQKVSMCWKRFSSFLFTVIHDAPKKNIFFINKTYVGFVSTNYSHENLKKTPPPLIRFCLQFNQYRYFLQ